MARNEVDGARVTAYRSRAISQAGTGLFLFAVMVLLPCSVVVFVRHNGSVDDRWERHNVTLAEVPFEELLTRLDHLTDSNTRMAADIDSVCPSTPGAFLDHQFFVIEPVNGQRCGPPVEPERLQPRRWVSIDGLVMHSLDTVDGTVVGIAIDPGVLLPVGWDRAGIALRLVSGGVVLASTDPKDAPVGSFHVPGDREVVSRLADSSIDLAIVLPPRLDDDPGWYAVMVAALVVVFGLVGSALRLLVPIRQWWRHVGAPDDAQLLLVDRHGVVRSASLHRQHDAAGTTLRERFAPQDGAHVDDLLGRADRAALGATLVCNSLEGPRVRMVIVGWLPWVRRHLVLITRFVADPVEAVISDEVNRARSSIVDADGTLLHVSIHPPFMLAPHASIGDCLYKMLEPSERDSLQNAQNQSLSQPFRVIELQLQHRWNRYRVMMVSDDRARTYLLVENDTKALLGGLVVPFVSQLSDYLRREGSPRPDVSLLRRRLRLASSHELHLDHVRDSADHRRAGGLQLVEDLQTLVHFADRDRLVQSSASEQRRSAARRREFARRLHEDVVQDLVALRWSTAADDATQIVYNRVLMTVRTILAELRVPPWEQRLRDVLAPVLQTVRNSGVSVSLHVDLPEPVPFELTSVVAVVTKEALTNAMKHARPDEVVVDLRIVGARQLLLTVSDDGTGTSTAAAGTGYGVSMCVELAEEYGGSFALTREAGGHVARLLMPLEIVPDESDSTSGGQPSTINSS